MQEYNKNIFFNVFLWKAVIRKSRQVSDDRGEQAGPCPGRPHLLHGRGPGGAAASPGAVGPRRPRHRPGGPAP